MGVNSENKAFQKGVQSFDHFACGDKMSCSQRAKLGTLHMALLKVSGTVYVRAEAPQLES